MSSGGATRVQVVSCRRAATTLPPSCQIAYAAPLTPRSMSRSFAPGPPSATAGAKPPGVSPPGATVAYTVPSAIQATASRLPSPAATLTSVTVAAP